MATACFLGGWACRRLQRSSRQCASGKGKSSCAEGVAAIGVAALSFSVAGVSTSSVSSRLPGNNQPDHTFQKKNNLIRHGELATLHHLPVPAHLSVEGEGVVGPAVQVRPRPSLKKGTARNTCR